jgi:hypothetical protein
MFATQNAYRAAFAAAVILLASHFGASEAEAKPVLTIAGNVAPSGHDGSFEFSRADLEALGMVTIETKTPWYKDKVKFEGVPLDRLMQRVGAKGDSVTVVALNDYSSEIPISDFAKYHPILAIKRNGEYMPVSDKGPLFIIYPFDSDPELRSQKYYSRAVWQVGKLVVH